MRHIVSYGANALEGYARIAVIGGAGSRKGQIL